MNPWIGWALAVAALTVGYVTYGWRGVVLGFTVIVFWLLLQFGRAMRVMRTAAQSPVGRVGSAVMFNARLRTGLRMMDVVMMTRSLGERVSETPEVWRWRDDGDSHVTLMFEAGRLATWTLERPPPEAGDAAEADSADSAGD